MLADVRGGGLALFFEEGANLGDGVLVSGGGEGDFGVEGDELFGAGEEFVGVAMGGGGEGVVEVGWLEAGFVKEGDDLRGD